MKRRIRILSIALGIILAVVSPAFCVSASGSAESYMYDDAGQAHAAPAGYAVKRTCIPSQLGFDSFGDVADLSVDSSGNLYLLCSAEGIIRKISSDFSEITEIAVYQNGERLDISGSQGFFISEYHNEFHFYIADSKSSRVIVADSAGALEQIFTKPKTNLISEQTDYMPLKITVNETGFMFVICSGIYSGAVVLSDEGEFIGFYGSNQIKLTPGVLYDYVWKKIFGSSRSGTMSRYVPIEFSNLAIDDKGFIYTVTASTTDNAGLRLINYNSNNIFPVFTDKGFGDIEMISASGTELPSSFIDITYMGEHIVAALDSARNRFFVYNNDGDLLTVTGGVGTAEGLFSRPTAIASFKDIIYVFDAGADTIVVFEPTEYGSTLLAASRMYMNGRYDESVALWESILEQNNGFHTAYISIGRALMNMDDYKQSMQYFKLGGARADYSEAFSHQRTILLKRWFGVIFALLIVGIAALFYMLSDKRRARRRELQTGNGGVVYTLFHPQKGFPTVFERRRIILMFPAVLLVWFLLNIAANRYTGFAFFDRNANPLDLRVEFIATILIGIAAVAANWLIVTMTEGNGTIKQIATVFSVSLLPLLGGKLLYILLSNVLVTEEGAFAGAPVVLGAIWMAVLLVTGLMRVHEFSFKEALFNVILTVLGIVVIAFILLLEISIIKQIQVLFTTVLDEIVAMMQ